MYLRMDGRLCGLEVRQDRRPGGPQGERPPKPGPPEKPGPPVPIGKKNTRESSEGNPGRAAALPGRKGRLGQAGRPPGPEGKPRPVEVTPEKESETFKSPPAVVAAERVPPAPPAPEPKAPPAGIQPAGSSEPPTRSNKVEPPKPPPPPPGSAPEAPPVAGNPPPADPVPPAAPGVEPQPALLPGVVKAPEPKPPTNQPELPSPAGAAPAEAITQPNDGGPPIPPSPARILPEPILAQASNDFVTPTPTPNLAAASATSDSATFAIETAPPDVAEDGMSSPSNTGEPSPATTSYLEGAALSPGAKAGIAIGTLVGSALFILLVFYLFRWRRRRHDTDSGSSTYHSHTLKGAFAPWRPSLSRSQSRDTMVIPSTPPTPNSGVTLSKPEAMPNLESSWDHRSSTSSHRPLANFAFSVRKSLPSIPRLSNLRSFTSFNAATPPVDHSAHSHTSSDTRDTLHSFSAFFKRRSDATATVSRTSTAPSNSRYSIETRSSGVLTRHPPSLPPLPLTYSNLPSLRYSGLTSADDEKSETDPEASDGGFRVSKLLPGMPAWAHPEPRTDQDGVMSARVGEHERG